MDPLYRLLSEYGYWGLFGLLTLGIVGLPIPDETLLTLSGYLVSRGKMAASFTLIAGFLGSASGMSVSYWAGRTLGSEVLLRYGSYIHLTQARIARVTAWFERVGHWLLTFGYFIPGVRHFTALVAGVSGLPFGTFARFTYPGALLWVCTFVALGYVVGDQWQKAFEYFHRGSLVVAAAAMVVGLAFWFAHRKSHPVRDRRSRSVEVRKAPK